MENDSRQNTADGYQRRKVFSVPAGEPFLSLVAQSLCDGRLIAGFQLGDDPLILTQATIYVPTRRAARELRSAFVDVIDAGSALLPKIVPLGEFDDDAAFFTAGADQAWADVPPAISDIERQ
ncbi:MAG: double-strand break repair protein AddB, partial [Pseudomonadota bacterium]